MKKIWNWLTEDFDACYDQEPLLPSTLKEWIFIAICSTAGLALLITFIYILAALEGVIYGF